MNPNYIVFAIPFFFLTIGIEIVVSYFQKKKTYQFSDAITNLNIGIGSQAVGIIGKVAIISVYDYVYHHLSFFQFGAENIVVFILGFIAFDCLYYWAHRWGHEWNVMWGAHIVHHQSKQYNLSVALRQSWIHSFISFWIFLPLPILGVHPYALVGIAAIITLYQYWIHTKTIHRFPAWIEYIFNTPSHHRVHHATNKEYLDKNYAAVFIIWDRLFGSFQKEEATPNYGITAPYESTDATWANVHFYTEVVEGMKKEKTIWNKLTIWFKGPKYLGELISDYYQNLKPTVAPKLNLGTSLYILLQFITLSAGLVKYLMNFDELTTTYQFLFLGLIVFTTYTCGIVLAQKEKLYIFEIIRLVVCTFLLNYLYYHFYQDWFTFMLILSLSISMVSLIWFIVEMYIRKDKVATA